MIVSFILFLFCSLSVCSSYELYRVNSDGNYGYHLTNFFNFDDQINVYNYILNASKGAIEYEELKNANVKRSYPIAYHNLVYTGNQTHNCDTPKMLFDMADDILTIVRRAFPYDTLLPTQKHNSLYAQIFHHESTMKMHTDGGVSWGVSFNIATAADFQFGEYLIHFKPGDIFIGDFGKVIHAVKKVYPISPDVADSFDLFGRDRCSIQVRYVDFSRPLSLFNISLPMSISDFKILFKFYK